MNNSVTFADLRRFLTGLGFVETKVPKMYVVFEHPPSGALFAFRLHRANERVDQATLASVRLHLVERELIKPKQFDRFLEGRTRPKRERRTQTAAKKP